MPPVTRGFSSSLLVPGLRQIYVETGKEVPWISSRSSTSVTWSGTRSPTGSTPA